MTDISSPYANRFKGINAQQLRLIALAAMLMDHLWATVVPGNLWMHWVGRIAFPIFAFQLAEGARHTSNLNAYTKRLLIYAAVSEIPFNLIMSGSIFYPFHQNVLFTLLFALLGIRSLEQMKSAGTKKAALKSGLMIFLYGLICLVTFVDYGIMGYVTILSFYLLKGVRFEKLGQFAMLLLLNQILFKGLGVPLTVFGTEIFFYYQCFALLALVPIWLYNGSQGNHSRFISRFSYIFYPAHMLAIYLIWALCM